MPNRKDADNERHSSDIICSTLDPALASMSSSESLSLPGDARACTRVTIIMNGMQLRIASPEKSRQVNVELINV